MRTWVLGFKTGEFTSDGYPCMGILMVRAGSLREALRRLRLDNAGVHDVYVV